MAPQVLDPVSCFLQNLGQGKGGSQAQCFPGRAGRSEGGMGPQPAIIMANATFLPEQGQGLLKKGKEYY